MQITRCSSLKIKLAQQKYVHKETDSQAAQFVEKGGMSWQVVLCGIIRVISGCRKQIPFSAKTLKSKCWQLRFVFLYLSYLSASPASRHHFLNFLCSRWPIMTVRGQRRRSTPRAVNVLETIHTSGLPVGAVIWHQRESEWTHFCARACVTPNMSVSVGFRMRRIAPVTDTGVLHMRGTFWIWHQVQSEARLLWRAAGLLHQPPIHYNAHFLLCLSFFLPTCS